LPQSFQVTPNFIDNIISAELPPPDSSIQSLIEKAMCMVHASLALWKEDVPKVIQRLSVQQLHLVTTFIHYTDGIHPKKEDNNSIKESVLMTFTVLTIQKLFHTTHFYQYCYLHM